MLGNFNLLDLLTNGATVTGTVLTDDSDLFGVLGLQYNKYYMVIRMDGRREGGLHTIWVD